MVFGRTDEEVIQLNEDTYWSGGPYSTTVAGGAKDLPEIRRRIFAGDLVKAHQLFGRSLMGYPVEQQKYQALGALVLKLGGEGPVGAYRNELDLDTAIATTTYEQGGVRYRREVFSSPVDQVIAVRLSADMPGKVSFTAQLRGERRKRTLVARAAPPKTSMAPTTAHATSEAAPGDRGGNERGLPAISWSGSWLYASGSRRCRTSPHPTPVPIFSAT